MSTVIRLTPAETAIAILMAEMRMKENEEANVQEKKIDDSSSPQKINIEGFAGEMAAAKFLNVYPDFSTTPRSGGHDLLSPSKEFTIDVKTTKHKYGCLKVPEHKLKHSIEYRPDIYLLLIGSITATFFVAGWQWADNVFKEENKKPNEWGKGYHYLLTQKDLRDPYELL